MKKAVAGLLIRRAHPADLTAVVRMASALWPEDPPRAHRPHMRAILAGEPPSTLPLVVLLALVDDQPIGFVEVGLRSHADGCDGRRPVGFIEGWWVDGPHRRRGVGGALIGAAEAWARERGCREMASDTWTDDRRSQKAHRALGYEIVDRCVHLRKPLGTRRALRRPG